MLFLTFSGGCLMGQITKLQEATIPQHMINATEEDIINKWGKPHRVYTKKYKKIKYDADEMWIYRYPVTTIPSEDYYLYFKGRHLINWEYVSWP